MSVGMLILLFINSIIFIYIFLKRLIYSCFIFQLENYRVGNLLDWYYNNKTNKKLLIPLVTSIISLLLVLFVPFRFLLYLELLISSITIPFINYRQEKKKLKYTNRMKRLLSFIIVLIIMIFTITFLILKNSYLLYEIYFISILIINFLVIDLVIIAYILGYPLERIIQNYYINKARYKILDNHVLKVIGITGSYGKTSTKKIINNLLKMEYTVCATPKSYNTPMGISLTVNKDLKKIDEFFICEMGARRLGEIKELCEIVYPKIGIITSIGPQHLDTFVNMRNIITTKFELIESLPTNGLAILNFDNSYIKNYEIKNKVKVLSYGIDNEKVDYYALNIHYNQYGSTFEVRFPNQERYLFKTKLLGKHNINNILAGIALADNLNIHINKIINAVSQLEAVRHRLELINFPNYTLIDDSYNANIEGSSNALDILNHFENKKIIITPGLVELGKEQDNLNYQLGMKISKVCDYVVLVGAKQTSSIYNALIDMNYSKDNIVITNSFNEGMNIILNNFKSDFTVLIENDLPDNFNEM